MKKSARERSASSKMISQGDYEGSQNPDKQSVNPTEKGLNETSNSK